jgi:type VI secretion system protein ImpH
MAPPGRRTRLDLIQALQERPGKFAFFQAMRMLTLTEGKGSVPRRLRFRTPPDLAFPRTEILSIKGLDQPESSGQPLEMEVGFMGMTGPSGVLPAPYTELVEDRRLHHQDRALHAFLDLFSHRAVSLFAQAWLKYRPHLGLEQGKVAGLSQHLLDLSGLSVHADSSLQALTGIPGTVLHFCGPLGRRPLPSGTVRRVVEGYFGVAAQLEQFVLRWIEVADADLTRLGNRGGDGLGSGAFLGQRQRDAQTGIRLVLGPLTGAQFQDLLPGGKGAKDLREMMYRMVGPTVCCEVRLILKREDVPEPRLKGTPSLGLGRDLWLCSRPPTADRQDAIYVLDLMAEASLPAA